MIPQTLVCSLSLSLLISASASAQSLHCLERMAQAPASQADYFAGNSCGQPAAVRVAGTGSADLKPQPGITQACLKETSSIHLPSSAQKEHIYKVDPLTDLLAVHYDQRIDFYGYNGSQRASMDLRSDPWHNGFHVAEFPDFLLITSNSGKIYLIKPEDIRGQLEAKPFVNLTQRPKESIDFLSVEKASEDVLVIIGVDDQERFGLILNTKTGQHSRRIPLGSKTLMIASEKLKPIRTQDGHLIFGNHETHTMIKVDPNDFSEKSFAPTEKHSLVWRPVELSNGNIATIYHSMQLQAVKPDGNLAFKVPIPHAFLLWDLASATYQGRPVVLLLAFDDTDYPKDGDRTDFHKNNRGFITFIDGATGEVLKDIPLDPHINGLWTTPFAPLRDGSFMFSASKNDAGEFIVLHLDPSKAELHMYEDMKGALDQRPFQLPSGELLFSTNDGVYLRNPQSFAVTTYLNSAKIKEKVPVGFTIQSWSDKGELVAVDDTKAGNIFTGPWKLFGLSWPCQGRRP